MTTTSDPPQSDQNASSTSTAPRLTNGQLLRRMVRFLSPVKGIAALACFFILLWASIDVLFTRLTGNLVTFIREFLKKPYAVLHDETIWDAVQREPFHTVVWTVMILGLLVVLNGIVRFCREVVNSKFTMDMAYHMRAAVYDRLQRVGFSFHDEHSSGQLINRALSDLQNVRVFLQMGVTLSIEIIAFVVFYELVIISINKWLAIAAFVPVPFWIWYIMRFSKKMQPAQLAQMKAGDDLVTVFTENVAGVHVVKAFATEKTEVQKYNKSADVFFDKVMVTVRLWRNFVPVIRGIASSSHLSLLAIAAVLVVITAALPEEEGGTVGGVKVGDLMVVGTAMSVILGRLQHVNQITEQYQKAITSVRRLFEILDAPPAVPEADAAPDLPDGTGAVEFHFVSFGYDPEKPVIRDIAFDAPGGSIVALVGPTGAGKSTIVQLLARFYDPQKGQIFIDGVDLKHASLKSVRKAIGFVFQETFLFSDTVANNIRYGYPEKTMGDVEAAARLAQAHEFIMELPQGYNTMLGERGATLSGGQRQRLAIARGIISNPRILVLDDALAAVDPETEHLISRALEMVMVDRTVFIIAHRLSTVKAADLVVVLERGRITQAGTHKELMSEPGHYRHIAEVQLAYQEKEIIGKAEEKAQKR
ncbi:MAG: ABC transporter ATP-binding protein/permease [Phycisphaerales bacterium]|nr:ABC transporter ATP-binding protein/permease [Phycisphaerales bacterium]